MTRTRSSQKLPTIATAAVIRAQSNGTPTKIGKSKTDGKAADAAAINAITPVRASAVVAITLKRSSPKTKISKPKPLKQQGAKGRKMSIGKRRASKLSEENTNKGQSRVDVLKAIHKQHPAASRGKKEKVEAKVASSKREGVGAVQKAPGEHATKKTRAKSVGNHGSD